MKRKKEMEEMNMKKLLEHRYILFIPLAYIYTVILLLFTSPLDSIPDGIKMVSFLPTISLVVSQGKFMKDYFLERNVEKSVFRFSLFLTVLGLCLMSLLYFVKG